MPGITLLPGGFRPWHAAPSSLYVPLYIILGFCYALSYRIGRLFPRQTKPKYKRRTFKTIVVSKRQASDISLAVVIPVFAASNDDKKLLESTVDIITSNCGYEVIVVDDCSPFPPCPKNCTLVRHMNNQGPGSARYTGVKTALESGVYSIAFLDSDCIPQPDWAKEHAKLQKRVPGIWAGRTFSYGDSIIDKFHERTGTLMPSIRNGKIDDVFVAQTCNLSVSAEVAKHVPFDTSFPMTFEDFDFCLRAVKLGYQIRISRKPILEHKFKTSFLDFCGQAWKYGRSEKNMTDKHPSFIRDMSTCDNVALFWPEIRD